MSYTTVGSKGRVSLPADVRREAHIEEGTICDVTVTEGGVLLEPKILVDADQAWFWSKEWQRGEHQANKELDRGGGQVYESEDEFQKALDKTRHSN